MAAAGQSTSTTTAWSRDTARHLLNRAGFGIPASRVEELADLGRDGAVEALLQYEALPEPGGPPGFLIPAERHIEFRRAARALSQEERQKRQQDLQRDERAAVAQLQAWWLRRMAETPRPLEEKLALFWHGHYATSAQKVRQSEWNYALYEVFRRHATGNAKALTVAVGQSPAMLRYLDNVQSTRRKPNENWARELMELFTLGVGQYTQKDVQEAARAFTGWSIGSDGFTYRQAQHDGGTKTFLGRTGPFDGWDIINIIYEQPAASRFLAGKLLKYFATESPDPAWVEAVAASLRAHSFDLKPVLGEMFRADWFYHPSVMGTQIKSPCHFLVQLAHDLEIEAPPYGLMARAAAELGQNLFYPPNVKGWDGNRAWINANTLLFRYNAPARMATAQGQQDSGTMMMGAPSGGGETMAPQGEDTMASRRAAARARFETHLATLPPAERRAYLQRWRQAAPREKLAMLRELGGGAGMWDATVMLDGLAFTTAGECVDALSTRYLAAPLAADQRAVLLRALGAAETDPLTPDAVAPEALEATLHLLFSCAEYQVC